jgi:thiamine monophosphate synthase
MTTATQAIRFAPAQIGRSVRILTLAVAIAALLAVSFVLGRVTHTATKTVVRPAPAAVAQVQADGHVQLPVSRQDTDPKRGVEALPQTRTDGHIQLPAGRLDTDPKRG